MTEQEEFEIDAHNQAERAKQIPLSNLSEDDRMRMDFRFRELSEFVGVDMEIAKGMKDKLDFLMQWGELKSKSKELVDILYEIKKVRDGLGTNVVGKTAVDKIYEYLRLSDRESSLFKELKSIKKGKELLKNDNEPQGERTTLD